jgi:hypothetical protein
MYVVVAHPGTGRTPAPNPMDRGHVKQRKEYVKTYFPGAPDEKQAGVVLVRAGETAKANFALLASETYRVSGRVVGLAPPQISGILLVSANGSERQDDVDGEGKFQFASGNVRGESFAAEPGREQGGKPAL